ncbi:lytic transglycosylase domain-containing protein [Sinanaerobacter sp. ZZT-01]|uniref:lytic transglycosylase domain-containing protein n=1 Tax=Sinanaerobacter sp. ZZT-01 TaxID=3111540 RepID=UPI002D789FDF|nr:lytic transglycosylase domain-containing protein [Sinanaerobacter sp. ZZT-01]WRR94332.1 lytic transglycosylase domain-containing protein [Sinanaerobacter sp. ZZT-01]
MIGTIGTRKKFVIFFIILLFAAFAVKTAINHVYPVGYEEYILKYSREYDIDPYLLTAIIKVESKFDKNATSHKGAIGLMQLMEPTAFWIAESMGDENFAVDNLYDPETNIKMGAWYVNNIRREFKYTELVLAAYNAGRGNVASWIDDSLIARDGTDYSGIPYNETRKYVEKVLSNQDIYRILYNIS